MTDQQQVDLQQERLERIIEALDRVATGASNYDTAYFLACELGVRQFWNPQKEKVSGKNR